MSDLSKVEKYLKELAELAEDPVHKRLINSYKGDCPKASMEAELNRILDEVIKRED